MTAQNAWRLDWPASHPGRIASATLKASPDTFFVDEDLGIEGFPDSDLMSGEPPVSGQGEHLCLRLEKTGDNTDYVARELAQLAGCRHHDVGFCGLKDRHAVTRQWFSLYRPGQEQDDVPLIEQIRDRWNVISAHRHPRKLRRGDHRGNRFVISLVEVDGEREVIDAALHVLKAQGCPNYFGPQRFGIAGGNLERAIAMKPGRHRKGRRQSNRNRDGLYFSAARSWLFNEILAERVESGSWNLAVDGDPAPEANTGPLWGDGGTSASGELGSLEREVAERHPDILQVFSDTRMKPERRPLVLSAASLSWRWSEPSMLTLSFHLEPGQYATTLIGNVFHISDAGGGSRLAEDT